VEERWKSGSVQEEKNLLIKITAGKPFGIGRNPGMPEGKGRKKKYETVGINQTFPKRSTHRLIYQETL